MVFNALENYTIRVEMVNDMAAFNPDSYIDGLWGIQLEMCYETIPRKIDELQNSIQRISIELQETQDKINFIKANCDLVGFVACVESVSKTMNALQAYKTFLTNHREHLNKRIRELGDILDSL